MDFTRKRAHQPFDVTGVVGLTHRPEEQLDSNTVGTPGGASRSENTRIPA